QVSLFDVSDLKNPTRLVSYSLGQGWSSAESDHHAFLYWPATNLVVVPFGQQAVALRVTKSGITELGRIVQTQATSSSLPQIDRSLVVRSALLTVSTAGVAANALSDLSNLGWAAFPTPPTPTPVPLPTPVVPSGAGGAVPGKAVGGGVGVVKNDAIAPAEPATTTTAHTTSTTSTTRPPVVSGFFNWDDTVRSCTVEKNS